MLKVEYAIQDKYEEDFAWCNGCGRLNQEGLHLRTGWDGDETMTIYSPRREHTAIPGSVYGGLLASLIDCDGTGSASVVSRGKNRHEPSENVAPHRIFTGYLHVDFMNAIPQDIQLKAVGKVEEIHPKKWRVLTEVYAMDECCARVEVIAVVRPKTFLKD